MAVGRCAIPRFDQAASGSAINGGQVHLSDGSTSPARQLPAPWPGDAERLPKVGQVFAAGEIDYHMFQTLVYRTDLITDPQVLARVDAELALRVRGWPSMTRGSWPPR